MPYKFNKNRAHTYSKKPLRRNWSEYNRSMKQRGNIAIWLSDDVINQWYVEVRVNDGTGTPNLYSDMAILTAHEIRQVFKLPLRQCEGFVNSLFQLLNLDLRCPSFSTMSKRLKKLNLTRPYYRRAHPFDASVKNIAIDSTGLKIYGEDEWVSEKYQGKKAKKGWRKLHVCVDNNNIIQTTELTERRIQDSTVVGELIEPIYDAVNHVTADCAYDGNPTYNELSHQFPSADIVIPPQKGAQLNKDNAFYRNRNILETECYDVMGWQRKREYGCRNQSELAIGRYKKILGNKLHARDFKRQKQEALIGCGILNKMMCIAMGEIRRKF